MGSDVQDIYVEDSCRKNGVAAYLMDYAEKMAKTHGAKVIRAGTGCENAKSQSLHKKWLITNTEWNTKKS